MRRDMINKGVETLPEYQYSFIITPLGHILTVTVKKVDLLRRCLSTVRKCMKGPTSLRAKKFSSFLNTLNIPKRQRSPLIEDGQVSRTYLRDISGDRKPSYDNLLCNPLFCPSFLYINFSFARSFETSSRLCQSLRFSYLETSNSAVHPSPTVYQLQITVYLSRTALTVEIFSQSAKESFDSLSSIAELVTTKANNPSDFLQECRSGAFNGLRAAYRTFNSVQITGRIEGEVCEELGKAGLRFLAHNGGWRRLAFYRRRSSSPITTPPVLMHIYFFHQARDMTSAISPTAPKPASTCPTSPRPSTPPPQTRPSSSCSVPSECLPRLSWICARVNFAGRPHRLWDMIRRGKRSGLSVWGG